MNLIFQATPRLSEDKVKQCVDPKLNNEYPPKAVAKVHACSRYINLNYLIWLLSFESSDGGFVFRGFSLQQLQHFVCNTRQISDQT